ncbi:hypothetical protein W97_05858 [Coniosporium apollinis CBS 100218]|uniref:MIF4G domain-containing protein n=1 Tax=Coniosporium apollinis (strain CBS 100218) TaxID=1168221 RepID=R7YXK7_CONA1|nr:uncharacterized protein W97_05858 [Coniosporium apollinis CBS 100218]EON66612.1 hypothetical protein W97_05858 [Coniosporium apollinis CBS 100218]
MMDGIVYYDPTAAHITNLFKSKLSIQDYDHVKRIHSVDAEPRVPKAPRNFKTPILRRATFGASRLDDPLASSSRRAGDYYRPSYATAENNSDIMADDDRRGGGRGYNNNNRKRRFREEDDSDRRPQRRRYEEPISAKLRRQLLTIAESPMKQPQDEAQEIAKLFAEYYEEGDDKATFLDLMVQILTEQPFKIPFAAAVVLYTNETKPEAAAEIFTRVASKLQSSLDSGNWRDVKLILRFFGCLQVLFEGDGVFPLLDELFDRAVDLQVASQEDTIGLELVKIILFTMPYIIASPAVGFGPRAVELLAKTEAVASNEHALAPLVEIYPGDSDDRPFGYQSIIGMLQKQLQSESEKGWELACIPRLFAPKPKEEETSDEAALTSAKHAFPSITVSSPINPGPKPLFPDAYFSLYADQDTVPKTTDIASSLLRDVLVDTINILDFNRNATAKFLIDMDCYWAPDTFVKRATPFDKLKDIAGDKSTWKPEDMAVDAVFSQIFTLPTPEHKLVYYHSVITESCKIAPAAIAPSLGRAIRFLFRHLDLMDMELGYRFMDWFAHHLSNFEFRWKWTEWLEDIDRSDLHPKKAFIIGALDKEIRLSFAKRIRETLPQPYHHLIPEGKEKDTPDFKYSSDQTPYAPEGRELLTLIRKKAPEEQIQEVIDRIHDQAAEHGISDVLIPSTDAYVTAICFIGSKSLSHVLSCIERCKERLLDIGKASDAARRQVIASVVDYWKDQPGIAVNIVDKLLNYSIVSPMNVVQWALGDHLGAGEALTQSWVYEMVAGTVGKVTNRMRQIADARLERGLSAEQIELIDQHLLKERESMRELFRFIDDAVTGIASGAADGFIERDGEKGFGEEEGKLIKAWGGRWARVFRRKAAVEESIVGEAAMEAKVAALGVQMDVEPEAGPDANGAGTVLDEDIIT